LVLVSPDDNKYSGIHKIPHFGGFCFLNADLIFVGAVKWAVREVMPQRNYISERAFDLMSV
jgi:hypothetical protein